MKRSDISTKRVLQEYLLSGGVFWRLKAELFTAPEKVIWAAMEREYDRGYIEYGMNLSAGWLTESGINKLKQIELSELET